ncbi:Sporulation protein YpeB [compost metagenome]
MTGFQASDYVNEHQTARKLSKPSLSLAQARKKLNSEFKEQYERLALIENDEGKEVLTYEFGGKINGSRYRIYLNADSGLEESIEEIRSTEAGLEQQ